MVSKKIIKRTPTKSIKETCSHTRRRKKTPIKNAAVVTSSVVLTTINKSFFTCRRRLAKFFSKLARISTTPIRKKQGFKILRKFHENDDDDLEIRKERHDLVIRSLFFGNRLPPMTEPGKRTIFLDLDETLIHSTPDPPPEKFDFIVRPKIDQEYHNFYVLKRPGLDKLLESLSSKFELVIFTAGLKEYASLVLNKIDPKLLITHRLYRDSCTEKDGKFVKDLSETGRDLSRAVIIDDNPNAYIFQPENAIPIKPFIDDLRDRELERLMKFFEECDCVDDMRDAVKQYVADVDNKYAI